MPKRKKSVLEKKFGGTPKTKQEFLVSYMKSSAADASKAVTPAEPELESAAAYEAYVADYEKYQEQKKEFENYKHKVKNYNMGDVYAVLLDEVFEMIKSRVETTLSRRRLTLAPDCFRKDLQKKDYEYYYELTHKNILQYVKEFPRPEKRGWKGVSLCALDKGEFNPSLLNLAKEKDESIKHLIEEGRCFKEAGFFDCEKEIRKRINRRIPAMIDKLKKPLSDYFTEEKIHKCIIKNPYYGDMFRAEEEKANRAVNLQRNMIESIPDSYPELFPMARTMKRHFILHIGPTNSGKTYSSVQVFKDNKSCIYLAPLRLLAYEQFENLNRNGIICSMRTGEERIDVPGAECVASTIEMAGLETEYDIAVIDEGQMITDKSRGGAWTAAVLGLRAKEIHVCLAPLAEKLYIQLIEECGDTFEIVRHKRFCPLKVERKNFEFPDKVEKGDALIVFSRKDVHAIASELQKKGIKTSVIYGRLPYEVRHAQAAAFSEGATDVLVATDAIGLGLNLPIRRIIFLSVYKYDGRERRELVPEEIRQIAGRAGRKGIYPEGYINAEFDKQIVKNAIINAKYAQPAENAVIAFPESLMGLDAPLLEILTRWDEIPVKKGFIKEDMKEKIRLCYTVSQFSEDKEFQYNCIMIPFDTDNVEIFGAWKRLCMEKAEGKEPSIMRYIPVIPDREYTARNLEQLEADFRMCDMLYGFCDKFRYKEYIEEILLCKKKISFYISEVLDKQELKGKICPECSKYLSWNYPYKLCSSCFRKSEKEKYTIQSV